MTSQHTTAPWPMNTKRARQKEPRMKRCTNQLVTQRVPSLTHHQDNYSQMSEEQPGTHCRPVARTTDSIFNVCQIKQRIQENLQALMHKCHSRTPGQQHKDRRQ